MSLQAKESQGMQVLFITVLMNKVNQTFDVLQNDKDSALNGIISVQKFLKSRGCEVTFSRASQPSMVKYKKGEMKLKSKPRRGMLLSGRALA